MPEPSAHVHVKPVVAVSAMRSALVAVLLAALGCLIAGPASASTTSTGFWVSLPSNVAVAPNDTIDTVVLSTTLALVAGESRRVSDRLGARLSSSEGAEVDNGIVCLDPRGMPAAQTSSGTNHPGSGAGELGSWSRFCSRPQSPEHTPARSWPAPVTGTERTSS